MDGVWSGFGAGCGVDLRPFWGDFAVGKGVKIGKIGSGKGAKIGIFGDEKWRFFARF